MPSPFPGMNPYLEHPAVWPDFHAGYAIRLRNALAPLVAPDYFVRADRHVYFHELPDDRRRGQPVRPDIGVFGDGRRAGGGPTTAGPAVLQLDYEVLEEHQTYLEVRDRVGERLVTVIELLSPSNKDGGPDREQHLSKRRRLIQCRVNYVELDLLRGGGRTFEGVPSCDYCAVVYRAAEHPQAHAWPLRLADPLPGLPVPLRPGDPEPVLDLQTLLHAEYDAVGYGYTVYRHPPDPPLTAEQATWAAGLLTP